MYLEKVYIGFTKTGKEHLFYKKNNIEYIDLKNMKTYYSEDIDLNSLVKLSKVLNKLFKSKKKVIEYYKLDRSKKCILNDLIVGDLIKTRRGYLGYNNKLFEKVVYNNKVMARDLIDGKVYDFGFACDNISRGSNYVTNHINARNVLDYDGYVNVVNKKRVLERNYKKFNRNK